MILYCILVARHEHTPSILCVYILTNLLRSLELSFGVLYGTCTKHHAMKTYWGSGGINPHWTEVSGRLHALDALPPLYPLDRRLKGPQSRFGRGSEDKKIPSQTLPGIETRSSSP
jgi:hypothetical protein